MAYTKLFNSLLTSTIWAEPAHIRLVWITMLAMADRHGEVAATIPGLARMAVVGIEECREAIFRFLAPDYDSRTQDDEGRRIEVIEGGWRLINHAKYRLMASKEDAKVANAQRQARHRAQVKRNGGTK